MKISYFLMLLIASMTLIFTACDDGNDGTTTQDKCKGNTCASEGKVCDPGSGECVEVQACTPECKSDETCNTVTGECESNTVDLCAGNSCGEDQVCDPADGSCVDFNVEDLDTIVKARKWSSNYGDQKGKILTKKLEGVVVGVKGLKTSSHHAVIIQQAGETEFAAIYVNLDTIKTEADFKDLAVGNLVKISGKLSEYFDRTELSPQTTADVEISAATATIPTAVYISSVSYEEKYESMLVNLTNAPFTVTELTNMVKCGTDGTCPNGDSCEEGKICGKDSKFTFTAKDSADKSILIGTSFSYPRVDFTQNEKITAIKGVMTLDYGEIVIFPTSKADVVSDGSLCGGVQCTADQVCANDTCVAKADENTDALCSDGIDNDGNGYTDCDDHSCSRNAAVTVCKVLCGGVECATGEVCVNDACVATEAEDTDAKCSDGIDNDGNGHTDCEDWSCSRNANVTVCAVTCGGVTCAAGQVCVNDACTDSSAEDTDAKCSDGVDNDNDGHIDCDDYDCSQNAAITVCGNTDLCAGNTCAADGKICDPATGNCVAAPATITITQVRAGTVGNVYTTEGTVTGVDSKGFYFQDANAGMYVFLGSAPTVVAGNNVTVTGKLDEYHNFMELKEATVTDGGAGTMPTAISVAGNAMAETHESMYVSLTGQPFTVTEAGQYDFTITDKDGNPFLLKKGSLSGDLVVGNVLSKLDGVVGQYDTNYRLVLRVATDMELVTFTCATPCEAWETCTATDTCTTTPGMCADNNDCNTTAGEECNTNHTCEVPAATCNPACNAWEECTATDTCTLKPGMCNAVEDCTNGATSCDNNVCVGGTAPQFPNANFATWTDDSTPTDWKIGNSGFAMLKTVRDSDFALSVIGTETGNKYVISTALTTMTDTKPASISFEMKGSGKITVNIACDLNADTYTTGEQKFYNLADATSTTFTNSGSNSYVEFNQADWTTYTITTGDELNDFWKAGVDCRLEIKAGKNTEFNALLDNVMINY